MTEKQEKTGSGSTTGIIPKNLKSSDIPKVDEWFLYLTIQESKGNIMGKEDWEAMSQLSGGQFQASTFKTQFKTIGAAAKKLADEKGIALGEGSPKKKPATKKANGTATEDKSESAERGSPETSKTPSKRSPKKRTNTEAGNDFEPTANGNTPAKPSSPSSPKKQRKSPTKKSAPKSDKEVVDDGAPPREATNTTHPPEDREVAPAADVDMPTPPASPVTPKKQRKSPVKKSKSPAKSAKEVDDEEPATNEESTGTGGNGNVEVEKKGKGTPKKKKEKVLPEPSNIGLSNEAI